MSQEHRDAARAARTPTRPATPAGVDDEAVPDRGAVVAIHPARATTAPHGEGAA
ncbi:hypothetical protein [Umezawaea tangerina]|uniref:hypothetical protein n=1 Tax=Umezawaea tangerina TaxID=84725 RepID=UPI0014767959|nr:hypothetical protein [Umezawaea tangerina]